MINTAIINFGVTEIRQCLHNAGYETTDAEFKFAHENDLLQFSKRDGNKFKFVIAFEDQTYSNCALITTLFVHLNQEGLLIADYGAFPIFEGTIDSEINRFDEFV